LEAKKSGLKKIKHFQEANPVIFYPVFKFKSRGKFILFSSKRILLLVKKKFEIGYFCVFGAENALYRVRFVSGVGSWSIYQNWRIVSPFGSVMAKQ
jgi:hypothetical protein